MSETENTTNTNTQQASTPVRYDLISINNTQIPDVKKGKVSITPVDKYEEHETEGGGKVIEEISHGMLSGSVSFDGLFQSELQTIYASIDTVSEMTIYSPFTNATKTFLALVNCDSADKIIHDAVANAWAFGFTFEEIGDVPT